MDTSSLKRLTFKESEELLMRIKEGDEKAREEFILANVRLVLSIIRRFDKSKVSADDMFQAGMIGLIKSADNFDLSVGVRFSTYAVPMNSERRNGRLPHIARIINKTARNKYSGRFSAVLPF